MAIDREVDIRNYWASVVKNTEEFQQIALAENPEFNALAACLKRALNDSFIQTATEYGVERWENLLNITPLDTDTLDDRKTRILTQLSIQKPYTWRVLINLLDTVLGKDTYKMSYVNDTATLTIEIRDLDLLDLSVLKSLLDKVLPCNIVVNLVQLYDRQYIQPVMASCTTWRNEPSFGMRVWSVGRVNGQDVIYDDDNGYNADWNPKPRYPYWPFNREPMPAWGSEEPFFYIYGKSNKYGHPRKICMEFDRPLIIKSIRFRQMMEDNSWIDVGIIRDGETVTTYRVPNFATRNEARQTEHIIEVPVEAQAPSTFYEFMAINSQYAWSRGLVVLNNDVYIDAVY